MANMHLQPRPVTKSNTNAIAGVLAAFIGMGMGTVAVQNMMAGSRYQKGEAAYQTANCEAAISHFDRVINGQRVIDLQHYSLRATARKAECQSYLEVTQVQTGNVPATLIQAEAFVSQYPSSALAEPVQKNARAVVEKQDPVALAQPEVCDRLDAMLTAKVLPPSDQVLPALSFTCGQNFVAKENYDGAVHRFQQILNDFPEHAIVPEVETAMAKAMLAQAKATGAGEMPQPQRSGVAARGSSVIVIRNDSPHAMKIMLTGAETRFEELAPCVDCQTFTDEAPEACPGLGPVGVYTVKPGPYSVIVSSVSSGRVTPFVGEWRLKSGVEYSNCFFLMERF